MDNTTEEAISTEELAPTSESKHVQQDQPDVLQSSLNPERKDSHGEDIPSLDGTQTAAAASDMTNSELQKTEVVISNTVELPGTTENPETEKNVLEEVASKNAFQEATTENTPGEIVAEIAVESTPGETAAENPHEEVTVEKIPEESATEDTPTEAAAEGTSGEDKAEDTKVLSAELTEVSESELMDMPEHTNIESANVTEVTNSKDIPNAHLTHDSEAAIQIETSTDVTSAETEDSESRKLQEPEPEALAETKNDEVTSNVEEISQNNTSTCQLPEQENVSGDQTTLESVMEAENAVAQIITPDDPQVQEVETHILVQNDSHSLDEEGANPVEIQEEAEISNIEYHVVLNDIHAETISMNGVHGMTKEEMGLQEGLYETQTMIKMDQDSSFDSETMGDIVTIASEVQNSDGTIITLPSHTVTEVTFTDVQMLEGHEGIVTLNEYHDQSDQVVILPEDQVMLMETEQFDHPESIQVNVMDEEKIDQGETSQQSEEQKLAKQLPNIPCHVLGRSVDNPLVDPVRNGRVLLKPRLGVKIPYRNLTSQIVSKQEIAEEIMERSRLRQSSAEPPAGGDVFFAKKLTQRLAKKLVPPKSGKGAMTKTTQVTSKRISSVTSIKEDVKIEVVASKVESPAVTSKPVATTVPKVNASKPSEGKMLGTEKIIDNNDLIALLEGDDVPDWNIASKSGAGTSVQGKVEASKHSSDWERETALKQLRDLPKQSKGLKSTIKPISYPPENVKESPDKTKEIQNEETDEKDDLNIVPRFASNTVVKTYTRKRKPLLEDLKPSSSSSVLKKAPVEEKSPVAQKPPVLIPLKAATPSSHKHPPVLSPQKQPLTPKSAPTVQKSSTLQKSSSSPVIQKASSAVQKSPSTSTGPKQPSASVAIKTATALKTLSPLKKSSVEEKKQSVEQKKLSAQDKKPQEKNRPVTPVESESRTINESKKLSPNTYISKSSRIVKRKKIWDPDEAVPVTKIKSPKPGDASEKSRVSPERKLKPVTVLKPSNEKLPPRSSEKSEAPKPKLGRPITVLKSNNEKVLLKKVKKTIVKRKRPKRLTEVDRLLMDEGAVNLLYSVNKNTEELQNIKRKKKLKTLISLDRAQRELLNKTNEIKNDLQMSSTKDSPISLRKKEGSMPKTSPTKELAATVMQRKKSKDSMSGSVHSPPASPGFAYAQHADASRIIRRHSSSSFSSENEDDDENQVNSDKVAEKKQKAEPQKKKAKVNQEKQAKGSIGIDKQLLSEEMSKNFNRLPSDDPKYSAFETFSVRKFDYLFQIILAPTTVNGQTTLSIQVLKELAEVLDDLQKDDTCRVVVISSSGSAFCQGIDYKELASDDQDTCQSIAEEYAVCVRNFLTALSKFSKLLVAGVHGDTIGLGVTMLPLFDMVLASDTATFSTPYARLGCAAEGGVLLTLPHVMHNALASELFFASRKLTAAEALRLGLVTRTLWPDKFQEELISALKAIAGQSLQSMQAIKKQLRHHLLLNVEASLKSESSILMKHWTSSECQSNFSSYSLESK